jgi:hypothetical protein
MKNWGYIMELMYNMRTYTGSKERAKWQAVFSAVIEVWVPLNQDNFCLTFKEGLSVVLK